jgi:cyclopropane-fatty-acyl-phospholipid synthase
VTASALYRGEIRHRRAGSPAGEFTHPLTLLYADLAELPSLLGGRLVRPAPGLVRLRRRDLLGGVDGPPTAAAVRALIEERSGRPAPRGAIRVLTAPRTLGMAFNPVSFYYCFDEDERLDTVVSEVTSTPWLKRHAYVLRATGDERVLRGEHAKALHVSPFQDMDHRHVWAVTAPGETLSVHIENHRDAPGSKDFDATLKLHREELTPASLRRATARQPAAALRTLGLIYGHAVALKLKGAPHFAPPADPTPETLMPKVKLTPAQFAARRAVLAVLGRLTTGRLELVEPDGRRHLLGPGGEPHAVAQLNDPEAWVALLRGSRGLGQSYTDGLWDSPELTDVVRLAARNVQAVDAIRRRIQAVRVPYQHARGLRGKVSRSQGRRDIHAHYDLGNDLFELMLDETMMYSAGSFSTPDATLRDASIEKLELVCDKLDLGPDDRVLEIGAGWGGFAIHAATTRGCHVTTTTISVEQHAYAVEKVKAAGVEHLVDVLLEDYRDLTGSYDRVVSLEMIEAVGWQDFPTFFRVASDRLERDGAMLLQAITMDDRAYEVEKASNSFIREQIFPNGCLPSQAEIARCLQAQTDLRMAHHEDLTGDYVHTLHHWRKNIEASTERLEELGYDERFRRLWQFYLCYCEGGFAERRIGVGQTLLAKPGWKGRVPATTIVGPAGLEAAITAPPSPVT